MTSTTYTVSVQGESGEFEARTTKSKKQVAVDLATKIRHDEKRAVRVQTGAGTLVFEAKARKPQIKTKPYTREVPAPTYVTMLPEGFKIPEGERVAYLRSRKACAITHDAEEQLYRVRDLAGAEVLGTFDTTRQCGRFLADSVGVTEDGHAVVVVV